MSKILGLKALLKESAKYVLTYHNRVLTPIKQRYDDIYLVSYPKSGNSWVSYLIVNTIIKYLNLNLNVNFFNMHFFIPDIHISRDIDPNLSFPPFRRIIKSHAAFNPFYRYVFLLLRNPIDTMISNYYYRINLDQYAGTISSFIRDKRYGIKKWAAHTESWLEKCYPAQSIHLFYYEHFIKDPEDELKRLFNLMGFNPSNNIIKGSIEISRFDNMRIIEKETQNYSVTKYDKFSFVRKGKTGQWKKELKQEDVDYILGVAGKLMEKLGYKV